jgi:hypothetical protein
MRLHAPGLSRRLKLFYGAGDIGFSLTYTALDFLFAKFLLDVVELPPALAAAAIFAGRSWDWINDPLVGLLTDRTRTRWGRRRPYLLFGAVPFGLAFVLLWWVPPLPGPAALAVYYGLAYFVFDAATTLVQVPASPSSRPCPCSACTWPPRKGPSISARRPARRLASWPAGCVPGCAAIACRPAARPSWLPAGWPPGGAAR